MCTMAKLESGGAVVLRFVGVFLFDTSNQLTEEGFCPGLRFGGISISRVFIVQVLFVHDVVHETFPSFGLVGL